MPATSIDLAGPERPGAVAGRVGPVVAPREEPVLLLAALAWAAGLIHVAAAAWHVAAWPLAAGFFALLATAQLAWGAWAWARPTRGVLLAGVTGSAAVMALWAVTRVVGLPLGPEPWEAEHVGVLDAAATGQEALLCLAALALLRPRPRPLPPSLLRAALIAGLTAVFLAGGHAH